jgi:hypothetical protein
MGQITTLEKFWSKLKSLAGRRRENPLFEVSDLRDRAVINAVVADKFFIFSSVFNLWKSVGKLHQVRKTC